MKRWAPGGLVTIGISTVIGGVSGIQQEITRATLPAEGAVSARRAWARNFDAAHGEYDRNSVPALCRIIGLLGIEGGAQ
jgi:hypothetical protein